MENYTAWVPSEYLAQYYATGNVTEDEQAILRFIVDFLKGKNIRFNEMIEIGCGPTIHHAIPFVPYIDRIYMADYLERNLIEIRKLIDQSDNAHDWQPYVAGVLEFEEGNALSTPKERMQDFRSKATSLIQCDVLNVQPLQNVKKTFPLVTSFYCLECASRSKDQWAMTMRNVLGLVEPDGWVILSALRNADKYLVGGKEFPATSIDENDVRQSLLANGFKPETITIQVSSSTWGQEGFDTIIVCSAQKGI